MPVSTRRSRKKGIGEVDGTAEPPAPVKQPADVMAAPRRSTRSTARATTTKTKSPPKFNTPPQLSRLGRKKRKKQVDTPPAAGKFVSPSANKAKSTGEIKTPVDEESFDDLKSPVVVEFFKGILKSAKKQLSRKKGRGRKKAVTFDIEASTTKDGTTNSDNPSSSEDITKLLDVFDHLELQQTYVDNTTTAVEINEMEVSMDAGGDGSGEEEKEEVEEELYSPPAQDTSPFLSVGGDDSMDVSFTGGMDVEVSFSDMATNDAILAMNQTSPTRQEPAEDDSTDEPSIHGGNHRSAIDNRLLSPIHGASAFEKVRNEIAERVTKTFVKRHNRPTIFGQVVEAAQADRLTMTPRAL